MKVENIIDIKNQNMRNILNAIRFSNNVTKKELMEELNLSFATVSNICRQLKTAGLIRETKDTTGEAAVGRSPMLLNMCYKDFYILCIDLHSIHHMQLALTNLRNELIAQMTFEPDLSMDFSGFTLCLHQKMLECLAENGLDAGKVMGVSVAVPAIYDRGSGNTVSALIPAIENQPLKSRLEELFQKPVYVDNETNASAVATLAYPESKNSRDIIYLLGSSGVGAGIISGGRLVTGARGYAAEVCHIPIGNPALKCHLCGQSGCIESDLSTKGFLMKYARITNETVSWEAFVKRVENNDPAARSVLAENAGLLGELASILTNMFDPDLIYIGGEIAVLYSHMRRIVEERITRRALVTDNVHVRVVPDLHKDALIQGCSEQMFQRIDFLRL